MRTAAVVTLVLGLAAASCDDGDAQAPIDVAGRYQISLTNGANGCMLERWQEGQMSQGVTLLVVQDAADKRKVSATVEGIVGGLISLWIGSNTFQGTASSGALDMTIMGTRAMSNGTCAYTTVARARAAVMKDAIDGTVTYSYATNGAPDCAWRTGCQTIQRFNGTRPPSM
jgi:hypothetical protein